LLSELDQPRKSVQFSEAVQVKTVEEPQEVEINEEKIDRWGYSDCLTFCARRIYIQSGCGMGQSYRNR
jgi:hypothetical protein